MGSFRLTTGMLHLHGRFNFNESILETVGQSLHHSCTSELTRQGISLPLDRHSYGRRLLGIRCIAFCKTKHFEPSSTGQVSDLIHHLKDLAKSCVFDKQSLSPVLCLYTPKIILDIQHPFSRSYEVILPSSFNIVLPNALVYSTSSPLSVLGTIFFYTLPQYFI